MNTNVATNGIEISVIVCTRNRTRSLRNLLASFDQIQPPGVPFEMLIVDNGSTDETSSVLRDWSHARDNRFTFFAEQPGKSRALNVALRAARGGLLVFVDDDVIVNTGYLVSIRDYFRTHDCAAAQGAVLYSAEAKTDPHLRSLLLRYGSCVANLDLPPESHVTTLCGANMMLRRAVFQSGWSFNEHLGPGAAGFSEDDALADYVRQSGGWLGYVSQAQAIHEINPARLTEEYFRLRHLRQGRSRYIYKPRGFIRILPNLIKAGFLYWLYSALGKIELKYREKGRWFHYREMLQLAWNSRRASHPQKGGGPPGLLTLRG